MLHYIVHPLVLVNERQGKLEKKTLLVEKKVWKLVGQKPFKKALYPERKEVSSKAL